MFERLRTMLVKEFLQVFRDPKMLRILVIPPILQVLVFGYAVSTDVRDVPTAVVDADRTPSSRELLARFSGSGLFRFVGEFPDPGPAEELLDRGKVSAILRIDRGFEGLLRSGRSAPLQVIVDGTYSNTALVVLGDAARIAAEHSRVEVLSRARSAPFPPAGAAPISLVTRAWFNENLESRYTFIPGVIGMIVMLVTVLLTSMAIVREKEIGTLEQLLVTPITPAEFILGKTLPFAVIGFGEVMMIAALGVAWFDLPLRGSIALLAGASVLYLLTTLGIGLLISTVSRTQQQAMMTVFFFYMPAVLLSGFVFPIANMPKAAQLLTGLDPLRYYLVILRGIFLKGVGVRVLWPQLAALFVMGVATLLLVTRRFRKTVL